MGTRSSSPATIAGEDDRAPMQTAVITVIQFSQAPHTRREGGGKGSDGGSERDISSYVETFVTFTSADESRLTPLLFLFTPNIRNLSW